MKLTDIKIGQTVFLRPHGTFSRDANAIDEITVATVMATGFQKDSRSGFGRKPFLLPDGHELFWHDHNTRGGNMIVVRVDRRVDRYTFPAGWFPAHSSDRYQVVSATVLAEPWSQDREDELVEQRQARRDAREQAKKDAADRAAQAHKQRAADLAILEDRLGALPEAVRAALVRDGRAIITVADLVTLIGAETSS